ncbi:hypothetical protein R6V09_45920 [Streptomyces sp. W16]|uniref:hypothetical protein n=1 Tax=Streptomyces sp. W16 TaxID=3076631 RepID=UPI00295B418C|nr:hypothetical protein [Streptomyces sp. W16]MDV9177456.1 hypothetical protein [Streptomyces sp. W16]
MGAAEIGWLDATALAELIRTRQVSSVEVVRRCLERIEGIDPRLNSIVTVLADSPPKSPCPSGRWRPDASPNCTR